MTEPFTPGPHDRDDTGHLGPDVDGLDKGPDHGPDPSSRRTTVLLAVSALAAVAIVIAAILIATSGSDDSPVAAGSSSSSTPTTETVTVTPSPTEETTTEETTTTTEETTTEESTTSSATDDPGNGREAVVYDCAGTSQVRPTDITSIYCGDNAVSLTNLEWSRWGSREAVGTGTEVRKVCDPNCAQGSTVGSQVQVTLGDVSKRSFTTVTVTDENGTTQSYRLTGRSPN